MPVASVLRQRLTSGKRTALSQAIRGLGGVGKTQLAVAYCHEHSDNYRYVLWVNAATEATLDEGYGEIARVLRLADGSDPEAAKQAVLHWFAAEDSWMLVLILGVAYYTYAERKVIGAMQARKGPNKVGFFGLFGNRAVGI